MSRVRVEDFLDRAPLIGLIDKAQRQLAADMVREARARGHREIRLAHNAVFGHLPMAGARTSEIAARAGITKQSMGEVVRELVELGIVEMAPDPTDGRAKLVTYSERGMEVARDGFQYLAGLERRYAEQFGQRRYETARQVLEQLIESFTPPSAG